MAVQGNNDVRAEMARAIASADAKRDELLAEISQRLRAMFLENLIMSPDQEPPVRRWTMLADLVVQRDLPTVSEPALSRLDGTPSDRRRTGCAAGGRKLTEWLESLCPAPGRAGDCQAGGGNWRLLLRMDRCRPTKFAGSLLREVDWPAK